MITDDGIPCPYFPTKSFRWYQRRDSDAWVSEGVTRHITTLQQYWAKDHSGTGGEWRDVPTEIQGE